MNDSWGNVTQRINRICDEFEQAWESNQQPRIEEYRSKLGWPENVRLFRQLVQLEIKLREGDGQTVDWSSYLARFPREVELLDGIKVDGEQTSDASVTRLEQFGRGDGSTRHGTIEVGHRGAVLGDYELLEKIGRGGMGVVYKGRDTKLNKLVAIKVLPLDAMFSPSARERFQNEAKAAAQLNHPHIVPVYAFGIEDGTYYFAMQFVEGKDLASFIRMARRTSARVGDSTTAARRVSTIPMRNKSGDVQKDAYADFLEAVSTAGTTSNRSYLQAFARVGIQVADALQHAHDRGIVHRDIKPSNLLIDDRGNAFVADFGLAQVQGEAELTLPGDVLGTLRYMSPEQAYAKRIVVDHRTDVFSLGATLYEMLTLRHAFDGRTKVELLRQVAFEDPPSPRTVNRRLPEELDTIVMKALAKSPDERYQTAAELAADLRAWQADEPIKACKPTLVKRTTKWMRKHRTLVGSAAMICVVVILSVISNLAFAVQAEKQRRQELEAQKTQLAKALTESEGRRLAAIASLVLPHNPGLSLALAKEGSQLQPSLEANNALMAAADANHERHILAHEEPVGIAYFGSDGQTVMTTGTSRSFLSEPVPARIFDVTSGKLLRRLDHRATITSAAFSPGGKRVLTASTPSDAVGRSADELADHPVSYTHLRAHETRR